MPGEYIQNFIRGKDFYSNVNLHVSISNRQHIAT